MVHMEILEMSTRLEQTKAVTRVSFVRILTAEIILQGSQRRKSDPADGWPRTACLED